MGAYCRPPEQLGITPSWEGEGERDGGHFTATKTVLTTNIIFFLAATLNGNFPFGAATFYSESLRLTFFLVGKIYFSLPRQFPENRKMMLAYRRFWQTASCLVSRRRWLAAEAGRGRSCLPVELAKLLLLRLLAFLPLPGRRWYWWW